MNATHSQSDEPRRTQVWPWMSLAVLAALILVYVVIIGRVPRPEEGIQGPEIGNKLTFFQLEPLTGESKPVSLDDLQGRVTLVNYWGTWCPPCRREFPEIVELAARFGSQPDFRLYAVSCGQGSDERLDPLQIETEAFLEQSKVTLPTYGDQHAESRRALVMLLDLDGFTFPTTMVLDRQGTIRGFWVGYDPRAARSMASLIQQLLKEPDEKPAP